jgi:tetratricopeptide (TPR) repeat protein/Tfp pilus assembly protein PilE
VSGIIEGYNYDIFISYRQKDNKGDRWVSEFVEALKTELESTFKEEISVYFDINPHDGLLETHDVDASLKEKLKCLIFIPIISRTYCDPKSFAWEHEFKAFVEQASNDQFGLKVKLPNGNVASRVLPVRIHHLDVADIKECESVLGGVLRGVEFVYKESGIDKPLAPDDDEKKNLNNTKYKIQVIKVAHAVKEIMAGMKAEPANVIQEKDQSGKSFKENKEVRKIDLEPHTEKGRWKLLSAVIIIAILIIASVFAYPKIFKKDTLEKLRMSGERISIAVMPFQNMTNDSTWNVWQSGIQDMLVTYLSNYPDELKVRQTEQTNSLIKSHGLANYASMTPLLARAVSKKLGSDVFIYGSIKQAGPKMRVNAVLMDTKTKEALKSFEIEYPSAEEMVFPSVDTLNRRIKSFLIISALKKGISRDQQFFGNTNSPEAYKLFISGNEAAWNGDMTTALRLYKEALAIDSNFFSAKAYIVAQTMGQGNYTEAKELCLRLYNERDHIPMIYRGNINWLYACLFETPHEEIKYCRQELQFHGDRAIVYFLMAGGYLKLDQYDRSIPEYEKCLELSEEWDENPGYGLFAGLGYAYHKTGQYGKERKLYRKASKYYQDNLLITFRQAVLALYEEKTKEANEYIEKFKSIAKEYSASDAVIAAYLGSIHEEAGILDKAEDYYRQALSLDPINPYRMNNLAWLQIDNDRNINEGLGLIDNALKSEPDNYNYLDTKGWGLFKQGKYEEALEFLEKSWALKPVYNHGIYLHLEAAKKAVAGLNID